MRVLAIGNTYPPHLLGGYEVIWQGAMRWLRSQGCTVRVLTTGYRRGDVAAGAEDDPDVQRELDWYWRDHAWPSLSLRARFAIERHNAAVFDRVLREFQPDVVAWWSMGGMSLGLIERARGMGIPGCFFVLDYWPSYGPQRDLWSAMWSRRRRLSSVAAVLTGLPVEVRLAQAGRWVFCSDAVREGTFEAGVRPADWAIARPGVARWLQESVRERSAPPWRWRLLYIGRVVDQKGVETAVDALAQLPSEATLRVVGDGDPEYRQRLSSKALALGVADRVEFEPSRPHSAVASVYRDSDAVVFPVRWNEPWGLVPLEAMALGRPVVATGRGGSGDYLEHERNSLLFEAGDAAALAGALTRLGSDAGLRERLRAGGYKTAAANREDGFDRRVLEELQRAAGGRG